MTTAYVLRDNAGDIIAVYPDQDGKPDTNGIVRVPVARAVTEDADRLGATIDVIAWES